jgi:hypothetical protein
MADFATAGALYDLPPAAERGENPRAFKTGPRYACFWCSLVKDRHLSPEELEKIARAIKESS